MPSSCGQEDCPMWDGHTCPCETFGLDKDDLPTSGVYSVEIPDAFSETAGNLNTGENVQDDLTAAEALESAADDLQHRLKTAPDAATGLLRVGAFLGDLRKQASALRERDRAHNEGTTSWSTWNAPATARPISLRAPRRPTMPELNREVTVEPSYDCLEVQPCVKGSDLCGQVRGASHGRGDAIIHFVLHSDNAEVRLILPTGWQHTATPNDIRGRYAEMNLMGELSELSYHSGERIPGAIGPVNRPELCPRKWDDCWWSTRKGRRGAELLVDSGSDALWAWLEEHWRRQFAPAEGEAGRD